MADAAAAADLDDILNSALDELDDEAEAEANEEQQLGREQQAAATAAAVPLKGEATAAPGHTGSAAAASSSVSGAGRRGPTGSSTTTEKDEEAEEERELQEAIAKTIGLLGKLDAPAAGENGGGDGDVGNVFDDEAFLDKLVEEFDRLGGSAGGEGAAGLGGEGGGGGESMVDGMVKQLLAKDLMYPPLKEVTRQFPAWLEEHRGKVEAGAYKRYEEQHALFGRIVALYEAEGELDMARLLDLMTQAQEYGQPPPEIVQALGVGPLDGGAEGVGMGMMGGMGMPPGLGLPLGPDGAPDPEACAVM